MKKKLIIAFLVFGNSWNLFSQRVSQKIGTNPTIIAPSAVVEIESTTKGFLPPRMTFAKRNAINSPATGLIVYCTDCGVNGELQVFNGTTWTNITGSSAAARTCRVPTNSGGYLVFKCHNLGADENADPLAPSWKLNGAYFQWGKKPIDTYNDNFRTKPSSGIEGFAAAPSGPGATEANTTVAWILNFEADGAWNLNESSPLKTVNDPCPGGFRVPTRNEWVSIYNGIAENCINVGTYNNSTTNYSAGKIINNSLYLPASGTIGNSGNLNSRGTNGFYWSSTPVSTNLLNAFCFHLYSDGVEPDFIYLNKTMGMSVRCVAE